METLNPFKKHMPPVHSSAINLTSSTVIFLLTPIVNLISERGVGSDGLTFMLPKIGFSSAIVEFCIIIK
jgi:hypothetical protein